MLIALGHATFQDTAIYRLIYHDKSVTRILLTTDVIGLNLDAELKNCVGNQYALLTR